MKSNLDPFIEKHLYAWVMSQFSMDAENVLRRMRKHLLSLEQPDLDRALGLGWWKVYDELPVDTQVTYIF